MSELDFKYLTVDEVLELVNDGQCTAEEAIEKEKSGKNRVTLINHLEAAIQDKETNSEEKSSEKDKSKKVDGDTKEGTERFKTFTILKNIKYQGKRYKIGEKVEVNAGDIESFIKSKIIEGD